MPKLIEDGLELEIPAGATVLQSCELAVKKILGCRVQLTRAGAAEMLEAAE